MIFWFVVWPRLFLDLPKLYIPRDFVYTIVLASRVSRSDLSSSLCSGRYSTVFLLSLVVMSATKKSKASRTRRTVTAVPDNPLDSDSDSGHAPITVRKRSAPDPGPSHRRPPPPRTTVDNPMEEEQVRLEDISISSDVRRRRLDNSVEFLDISSAPAPMTAFTPPPRDQNHPGQVNDWSINMFPDDVVVEEVVGLPGTFVRTTQNRARYENSVSGSMFLVFGIS